MSDPATVDAVPATEATVNDPEKTPVPSLAPNHLEKSEVKDTPELSRTPSNTEQTLGEKDGKEEMDPTSDPIADEKADNSILEQTMAPKPPAWRFFLALAAVMLCAFLYGLDTTIAADVQASVYKSLGEIGKIAWIGIGFPLGSAGTILPVGYAFGQFNLKTLFISGLVLFEAGSGLCGGAPNMNALIIGRVIAGIGGCIIYLGALNFITIYTTIKERSLYTASLGLVWAIGTILGPVIGGAFASSSATWRWAFYINICLFGFVGPVCVFVMPSYNPNPNESVWKKLAKLDWIGAVLIAGVFTTFILAFSFGGTEWAWNSGQWIALVVVFGVLVIAFCIQQGLRLFTTPERQIFPVQFLTRPHMLLFYITMGATTSAFFFAIYYIPLYFQFTHGDSAIKAAVRLLPFICVAVVFMMFQGAMLPVFGWYFPWYIVGGIFILIGGCVMHTINPETDISRVYGFSIFIAIGTGFCAQGGYALAAAKTRGMHEIPASIGFMNIAQIGSVAIALCVSGEIFQNIAFNNLSKALAGHGFTTAEIRATIAGTQSGIFEDSTAEVRKAAIAGITNAIDKVYIQAIACGAVDIICGLLMKWEKLDFNPEALVTG